MIRTVLVAAFAVGAVSLPVAAQAAPGDPIPVVPQGCYLLGLPPGQEVVCPSPAPVGPTLYSVCTPLAPAGDLPRKSCQRFSLATGDAVGDPQIFVYPPSNTLTPPPAPQPATRPTYVAPGPNPVPARTAVTGQKVDTSRASTPTPGVSQAGTDAGLITEPAGAATRAAPTTSRPFVPNSQGEPANQPASNKVPLTIAGVALLFLIGACVWKPRGARKGAHRREGVSS